MSVQENKKFVDRNTFFLTLILVSLFELAAFVIYYHFATEQASIAYVRSDYLIANYQGTREAKIRLDGRKQTLQANLDTLSNNFQRSLSGFNMQGARLSRQAKADWEKRISIQEQQLNEYAQAIENQVQAEDEKMVKAILNQIDGFTATYAKRNGYKLILSKSQGVAGVLYGVESVDITENLLKELNANYKGE